MADGGTALRTSDLVLTLVQCGGITGLEMRAVLKLSEVPPVDADGVRALLRRGEAVWGETVCGARRVRVRANGVGSRC